MTTLDEDHDVIEKLDYIIVNSGQVSDRPVVWVYFCLATFKPVI